MTKILSIYDGVKKTYFPDWDRDNQWRVELKDTLTDGWLGNSFSDRRTKTIEIYQMFAPNDDNEWYCLIAHQITHVITGASHNLKWISRFLELANQADLKGQKSLARFIRENAEASRGTVDPNINPILQNIEAAISENPEETREKIIESSALAMGVSGDELLKRCPLVKTYYDSVKDEILKKQNLTQGAKFSI